MDLELVEMQGKKMYLSEAELKDLNLRCLACKEVAKLPFFFCMQFKRVICLDCDNGVNLRLPEKQRYKRYCASSERVHEHHKIISLIKDGS